MRTNSIVDEDYTPTAAAAASAEPFRKPNHKAKKHSRPRANEKIGGGHFVFHRGAGGRMHPSSFPYEHANLQSALTEAQRLHALNGGAYSVVSVAAEIGVPVIGQAAA